jgi:hypothetical protein
MCLVIQSVKPENLTRNPEKISTDDNLGIHLTERCRTKGLHRNCAISQFLGN